MVSIFSTGKQVRSQRRPLFCCTASRRPLVNSTRLFRCLRPAITSWRRTFLEQLGIERYSLYLHDYGGPVGFRMMQLHPERLRALIVQNANAYREGLGVKWAGIANYWTDRAGHPEIFEAFVSQAATEQRHTLGTSRPERYNPDTWTDEFSFLSRPGQREIQAELFYDYRTNVAAYSAWQAWLQAHQPPTLVVWGRNDPSFVPAGAEAFKRALPEAQVHLLDAGHFALDERNDEIAGLILRFMDKQGET
jgi:pimeloyl-ACP methyl ester carboxylesterase